MVCKEDVVLWFRELSGHKRIDVMCSLLNKCLPTELRFFGTCLEDLGKQHFNHMKDFEVKANNPTELSELLVQCIISDTRTRQKLALYICLIHSLNTTCSNNLFKTLSSLDVSQIVPLNKNTDEKLLEELLLIYTIAVNHPAFTYDQKATLGNILWTLREKEEQLQAAKLPEGLSEEYINSALNLSSDCTDVPPTNNPTCAEMPPRNIPPGE
ncbi:UNVERIFIED_CONTAM: hypothetical protein PYX00_006225 [Menopon gallinae]|uniref:Uncharacterized protein n=1 Tax=Menopon gallinae TaxID=328185 RepID=A0AAW2HW59_9NEOP